MADTDPAPKLDYATPEKAAIPPAVVGAGGFVGGVVAVVVAGCGVFSFGGIGIGGPPRTPAPLWWAVILFAVLMVGSIAGAVTLRSRRPRQHFIIGLLLGVGVMALIEGFCYMNP